MISKTSLDKCSELSLLWALCAAAACSSSDTASGLLTTDLATFALFGGSGITFAGGINSTTISGDIGSFPTAAPLSGNTKVVLNGVEQLDPNFTAEVALDVKTVYNNAMAKTPRIPISGDIGGQTLFAGIYFSESTIGITGNLTLDANHDVDAVFLIISGSATFFAPSTVVILANGAQACRVFWVFGSSATVNANCQLSGTMIAYASITVGAGSSITGSLIAQQAIILDSNMISRPECSLSSTSLEPCNVVALEDGENSSITLTASFASIAIAFLNFVNV